MANTKSAKKAIRSSARKAAVNLKHKKAYKQAKKDVLTSIEKKTGKKNTPELLARAYKEIDKAAKANVIHKNAASRYKSRLAKKAK